MKDKRMTPLIILFFLFLGCKNQKDNTSQTIQNSSETIAVTTHYSFKIIDAPSNTYGYDIFANTQKLIHQPHKPGVVGIEGFKTSEQATKVASLVIQKLQKGIMPPSISEEELQSIGSL